VTQKNFLGILAKPIDVVIDALTKNNTVKDVFEHSPDAEEL